MTIYKIQYVINYRPTRGKRKGQLARYESETEIIIDKLPTAKRLFDDYKNKVENMTQYAGYSGTAELLVPHIHDNGKLSYYPVLSFYGVYIEKCEIA